jgi:predicted nucleotidyltransferase
MGVGNIIIDLVSIEISEQVSKACTLIEDYFTSTLIAIHLYGSATDGGLKPQSDIDLLVTLSERPDGDVRKEFLLDLLSISAAPGENKSLRALEVTVIVYNEVVPWRCPARRELQFGEWIRKDILAGIFEPAVLDMDLTILLKQARQHSLALVGPSADELFEAVPDHDFYKVLSDSLNTWKTCEDWVGDERNIVLTLARIWYSATTGNIAPKDIAADWLLERLPIKYQQILYEARQAYLGLSEDNITTYQEQTEAFIVFSKTAVAALLCESNS